MGQRSIALITAEAKLKATLQAQNPNSTVAIQDREAVSTIRKEIDEYRRKLEKTLREQEVEELKESLAKNKALIGVLDKQKKDLDKLIEEKTNEFRTARNPTLTPEAMRGGVPEARDEVTRKDQTLKYLGEQMGSLEADLAVLPQPTVIQAAQPPKLPRLDRKLKMAGMGGVGLFGVAAMAVALAEFGKRRVYGSADVSSGLGLDLLGTLPPVSAGARTSIPLGSGEAPTRADQRALLESVNAVRTVLLHAARNRNLRTIMVSSPEGGEGKTTLACQLAASLARSGRRTLLLDLDLRDPEAHVTFDLPLAPGFSELLRGEAELDATVYPTALEGLSVLPAGQADGLAIQALARDDVGAIIKVLREHFDFIIVDTSPVLAVADTMDVGQYVDGVVLSVLRGVSRLPAVYAAQQRLAALGIHVLGAVLTGDAANPYGMVRRAGW